MTTQRRKSTIHDPNKAAEEFLRAMTRFVEGLTRIAALVEKDVRRAHDRKETGDD